MRSAADSAFSPFQGHNHQKWRNHPHVFGIHPRDRAPATSVPGKSHVGLAERPGVRAGVGTVSEECVTADTGAGPQQSNSIWYERPHTPSGSHILAPCVMLHPTSVNLLWWLIFSHLWPVAATACSVSFHGLERTM